MGEYMDKKIRVLLGKVGLDGHNRGVRVVAQALMDAGMEVIYTGIRNTPEDIVNAALQEDVDAVGLSILSGAHNILFPKVAALMKEKGLEEVILFGGGIIPESDYDLLFQSGFKAIFGPGTSLKTIVDFLNDSVKKQEGVV